MMKTIFVPHIEEISEWKQCYYDFGILGQLRQLMQESADILSALKAYSIQIKKQRGISHLQLDKTHRLIITLQKIMYPCNKYFYQYSQHEVTVTYMFAQYKSFEIRAKFFKYQAFTKCIQKGDYDLTILLENLYIQSYYLKQMISFNISQQQITILKFQELTKRYAQLTVDVSINKKMNRMKKLANDMTNKIQEIYILKSVKDSKTASSQLKYSNDSSLETGRYIHFFGFWTGILATSLACILFFIDHQNLNIQTDKKFQSIFPIWRGASYVILYFWVLGFDVLAWEVLKIDYKLFFHMDSNYIPRSSIILLAASAFTGIYLILFAIFIINRSLQFSQMQQQHLAGMAWLSFLIFLFFPFPVFHHKGRLYFLYLLLQALLSPLTQMTFLKIWVMQQIVSFNQPASDFVYTICRYVTNFQANSSCNNTAPLVSMIVLAVMFLYRMIQNFKMGMKLNAPLWSPPYMGFIRAFLSLLTVIIAYMFRRFPNTATLVLWIIFAAASSIWAWFVDVKFDWGFFANLPNQRILRPKLIAPKLRIVYYFMIVLNLALRVAWVLTISPAIVKASGILPYLFIMILSFAQIIRRGIWNYFRIEFEYVLDCQKFRAIIEYSNIEQRVAQKYWTITRKKVEEDIQYSNLKQIRTKSQLELLMSCIRLREQYQNRIKEFLIKSRAQIQAISSNLPSHIRNLYL